MAEENEQKDNIDEMINSLTPEQQERLRRKLNFNVWVRRFEFMNSVVEGESSTSSAKDKMLGKKFAALVQQMIDEMESPDASNLLLPKMIREAWQEVLLTVNNQPDVEEFIESAGSGSIEYLLEQTYQNIQNQLIQVRQAVAQAIAAEKQLEMQCQKNKDQASTWESRASMARQQGNQNLVEQAQSRAVQYKTTAEELVLQLQDQKIATNKLRAVLTEIEGEVQKLFTRKQVLLARDKAASMTNTVQELMSNLDTSDAGKLFEKIESAIIEKEQKAATAVPAPQNKSEIDDIIAKAILAIDKLSEQVARIELRIAQKSDSSRSE